MPVIDPKHTTFKNGVYYFGKAEAETLAAEIGGSVVKKKIGYVVQEASGALIGPEAKSIELIGFRFDADTPEALLNAQKIAGKMITEISKETEANIRNLIANAIAEGIPPYDAARAIRPLIGLTSSQGQAALKFRKQLIDNGLPLEKVNAQVDRYATKLLNARADRIARTEIMDALNNGQGEAWLQAQSEGYLSENATKEWIVTPDDLLCPECEPMDGKTVPINEEFPNGDPPLHPSCRCTIAIGTP